MALSPRQLEQARELISLAESRGVSPARAREFAAAAYSESGLDPNAHNPSGADGLFQLLSSGYRQRAQKLGGVRNPRANALAILPDYISYWRSHPRAAPGEAGRDVERSGMGADFYSKGLPLIPGDVAPEQITSMIERHASPNLDTEGAQGLLSLAQGHYNPMARLHSLLGATRAPGGLTAPHGTPMEPTVQPKGHHMDFVSVSPSADRQGVPTRPEVLDFVGKIGQLAGQRLTIGTGSNHHEYVSGEGKTISDHWFGEAADIPAAGAALTKLGQDALIAAGANPAWARQQQGGVYNIGGYNILFNTHVGGNHFNHLHVGLGRILGRPR